jgi:hypothetical protein
MRFTYNDRTENVNIIEPEIAEWFKNVFASLKDDTGEWVHPDTNQVWRKVGNLNRCFVLMNPDQTYNNGASDIDKMLLLRNAYYIAAAFPGADVWVPLTNDMAKRITTDTEESVKRLGAWRVHAHVVCLLKA